MRVYLRAFFVGSSFPVVLWPFLYLGLSFTFNPLPSLNMGTIPLFVPILLGLANMVYMFTEQKWSSKYGNRRLLLFGAGYGLLASLYGNFVKSIPVDLFLLSGSLQYITIPVAMIVYALIWRYIIKHLNKMVGIS